MAFFKKLMLMGVPVAGLSSIPFLFKSQSNAETVKPNENSEEEDEGVKVESELDVGLIDSDSNDDQLLLSLLRQAGLQCKGVSDGSECQIGTKKKGVEISRDSTTKDSDLYSSSGGGKLVIHKINDNNYKRGIRFDVEKEDIVLEKRNGESLNIQKLERFESYGLEIEEQEGNKKLYLARKQTSQQGIMRTLGLPTSCTLPTDERSSTKCDLNYHIQIKDVHFEGKKRGGAAAIVTNNLNTKKVSLTIEKTTEIPPFNGGYKFTFTPDVDVEISSGNTIKKDQGTDFRIIEWKDRKMSLERAWKDSDLIRKAGLECADDGYCTIKNGFLNVMQDDKTLTNANATMNGAKIKLYKNQNHYENGIKFVIEGGDINLSGSGSISKLSRYEGYEIVNKDNIYYLNRRHLDIVEIVKLLGGICNIAGSKNPFSNNNKEIRCSTLISKSIEKIKFDGIQSGMTVNTTSSLSIEKTEEKETFRYGYKFKFTPGGDITISSDNKLKKDFATYFKIKGDGETISLERAVKPDDLIEKVGLECTGETCSFKDGRKINVTLGHLSLTDSTPSSGEGVGTLKLVDRNNKDYNEGLKFEVTGGDITFTGNDGSKARMGEFDTYEIKETNGRWHLHQKRNFLQNKHNAVGIPGNCNNAFSNHCNISGMSAAGLHFKEKKSERVKAMFSSNASLQLRLERDSLYKYGIKVLIKAVNGENPTLSLACEDYDPNVLFRVTKDEMEFEIEKDSNNSNRFILEKRGGPTPSNLATDCKLPVRDE